MIFVFRLFFGRQAIADYQEVRLYRQIDIPAEFLIRDGISAFGGDIRIGDVSGDGICDFVVYRSAQGGEARQHQGGIKPCYIAAFDIDGKVLVTMGDWSAVQVRCQRSRSLKVYFWNRVLGSTTYDAPRQLVDAGMVPSSVCRGKI